MAVGGAVLLPLLSACESPPEPSKIQEQKRKRAREYEGVFMDGDVFFADGSFFLPRAGSIYWFSRDEFEEYRMVSKLDAHGRKIFIAQKPQEKIVVASSVREELIDNIGNTKRPKPWGGEILLPVSGFLDDESVPIPYATMIVDKTFARIKGDKGLASLGWDHILDAIYFTYGAPDNFKQYDSVQTAVELEISINRAEQFIDRMIREHPLAQFNAIGHSLGALLILFMMRKHPGVFNNAVLFSVPARGLEPTDAMLKKLELVHEALKKVGIEEYLTQSLLGLWHNREYNEELDAFTQKFVGMGRGLYSIIAEDDGVVDPRSAHLKGAVNIVLPKSGFIQNILDPFGLKSHGRPLIDDVSGETVKKAFGKNLAAAA